MTETISFGAGSSRLAGTIEVAEEVATVGKRTVTTGRVSVRTLTETFEESLAGELASTTAVVERVPVDRIVDAIPAVRVEDGVTIVPVFEEVLVVERRIRLVEELHIRHAATSETVRLPVTVRRQRAVVKRLPVSTSTTYPTQQGTKPMSNMASSDNMMSSQTVTAFFDSRTDAEAAVERIVDAGVARGSIRMVEGADATTATATTTATEGRGFFESLGDFFMPEEDRHSYAEGLRRGGYLVSVPTTAANRDAVLDILDDEGTVDMDAREASWKSEGWSGTETGYASSDRVMPASGAAGGSTLGSTEAYARTEDTAGYRKAELGVDGDRDGTIEIVEENLRVGKRDVSHGRVRVRSYVVEDAVSQDVNLRSERVEIERRMVDRPVADFDAAFRDQTIELEETAEEAVVSKEARVKEEIDLNRLSENRTETVSDTVRRTEVEIEDERTGRAAGTSSVTGGDAVKVRRDV